MAYKRISPQPVDEGGTGASTLTDHGVLVGSGTGAVTPLAVGTTGTVLIGTTASDPSFSATPSVTSISFDGGTNNLGDYDATGTWTPGISFGGGTTGITYGTQNGVYMRIGSLVVATFQLVLTNKGSSTGSALITGLPITSLNEIPQAYSALLYQSFTITTDPPFSAVVGNSTTASLFESNPAGAASTIDDTYFSNSSGLFGTLTYRA